MRHQSDSSPRAASLATTSPCTSKFFTLNVPRKLSPLRHFIEFHNLPELLCLQKIGIVSSTFRFHPLYATFFSVGVQKCLSDTILIGSVAHFSAVK